MVKECRPEEWKSIRVKGLSGKGKRVSCWLKWGRNGEEHVGETISSAQMMAGGGGEGFAGDDDKDGSTPSSNPQTSRACDMRCVTLKAQQ